MAGVPNIVGRISMVYLDGGTIATGAMSVTPKSGYSVVNGDNSAFNELNFDASKSSTIYGNSNIVQPPAITLVPQLRY